MTTAQWRRVQAAFLEIADLPKDQQSEALNRLGSEIREEVAVMLAADDPDIDTPIDEEWEGSVHEALSGLSETEAPERVGPYRTVHELGRGGMGIVYLAERADEQFEQTVALKLVKRGMDTDAILTRFLNERQVLAALQHPNIARLYDGGVTEEGQPWFAMEYVDGSPITDYCNKNDLSLHERLELFQKVCHAVRHAHNRLIIHRDLKPSNILVTKNGEPKLLDFGLAKVLQDPTGDPATTRPEQRWMTLDYASPEQVRGEAVGTPSDTYQLGLVLYELLTGQRAYTVKGLSSTEAERVICEVDPPRPSTAVAKESDVASHGPAPANVAVASHATLPVHPEKLRKRLRGDLDIIILKALHKDPTRGYASAETLATDIQRHLDGLPIHARPDTAGYRVKKFAERHRWGVAAASFVSLLVLGSSMALFVQNRRIARESERARLETDKAEEVTNYLVGIFEANDPNRTLGEEITAREVLDEGVERIREELADEPAVQAKLFNTVGQIYRRLALYERAVPLLNEALEIRQALLGNAHPDVAESLHARAGLYQDLGDHTAAETLYRKALAIRRRVLGPNHPLVAETLSDLLTPLRVLSRHEEAEPIAREALAIYQEVYPSNNINIATAKNNLATLIHHRGDLAEAEQLYREALTIHRRHYGDVHSKVATDLHNLATMLTDQGRYDEAERLYRQVLEIKHQLYPDGHPTTAYQLGYLGHIRREQGDVEGAERAYREAVELLRRILPPGHSNTAGALWALGRVLLESGKATEAEPALRESFESRREVFGPDHEKTLQSQILLGSCLATLGRQEAATALLNDAAERAAENLGEDHEFAEQARAALTDI